MRKTIEIRGARENNLRGVDLEIPRDELVVITGVSGSGKSSLAFETIYAEGQRRLLASMSSFAKRFVSQLKKPDVDFVTGLSPVISIDQKTVASNPRSTVGTMTDISDYLRMLFATVGQAHCPFCGDAIPSISTYQMMEHMLGLPDGAEVEVRAPVGKVYGEDYEYLFEQIRTSGYRRVRLDGEPRDLGSDIDVDEDHDYHVEVVIDRFVVQPGIDKQVLTSLEHGGKVGDGLFAFHVGEGVPAARRKKFHAGFGCRKHRIVSKAMHHGDFTFNDPAGACVTCAGIGTSMRVHPPLLVPDPTRTLADGAIVKAALNCDKNTWGGRILHSLSEAFGLSLDVPYEELPKESVDMLLYGTGGRKFTVKLPPGARQGKQHEGKEISYSGIIPQLERTYRWYRKQGSAHAGLEEHLKKVMVEFDCPDCGGSRLKAARRLVTVSGRNLYELGDLHLVELLAFLDDFKAPGKWKAAVEQIRGEVRARLGVLVGIGLDYLSLNRRSGTLSGGESQRIRLSSQIGSGLMGMLYVLDEPSIGLHPKDNVKMIDTLRRMRDLGNTVIVVEHDEDTIRAADHLIEIGPGPGKHGGEVVAQGTLEDVLRHPESVTGQFLSGARTIDVPAERRVPGDRKLSVRGARQNNLDDLDVDVPLGVFVCVTGASGSGKSSLVHDILYKRLYALLFDSRVLSGDHDSLDGWDEVDDLVHIDQSPIGRSPRSNPATYIGFYDAVRKLFAATDTAVERGYGASRFSFNVKGGRCEECGGEGTITTQLSFMPDVEVTCPTCKGLRYNQETLEVLYRERNIAEVLEMSLEEGREFFADQKTIAHKINVLCELGLGYLRIGHPAPILSGGEAQRVKLAGELGKMKRGKHKLYILDEPTTGLHFADIQRLLDSLNRLVDAGHSVVVIEHNLDVIKTADHIIDLGPEGGHGGGRLLAQGTPEEVAKVKASYTGRFLKKLLTGGGAPRRRAKSRAARR